jgi:hypothetical protein
MRLNMQQTSLMVPNSGYQYTTPSCLRPGHYLVCHEVIALHAAHQYPASQFYPICHQLQVTREGNTVPSNLVSFPGAHKGSDRGITYEEAKRHEGSYYYYIGTGLTLDKYVLVYIVWPRVACRKIFFAAIRSRYHRWLETRGKLCGGYSQISNFTLLRHQTNSDFTGWEDFHSGLESMSGNHSTQYEGDARLTIYHITKIYFLAL